MTNSLTPSPTTTLAPTTSLPPTSTVALTATVPPTGGVIPCICAVAEDAMSSFKNWHPKRKGDWAESIFLTIAIRLGFHVCKPWGDNAPFDFILEKAGHTCRVQIKSVFGAVHGHYQFLTMNTMQATYRSREVDFLACYVATLDLWYIVPVAEIAPEQKFLYVFPEGGAFKGGAKPAWKPRARRTKSYEKFLEAWDLLG